MNAVCRHRSLTLRSSQPSASPRFARRGFTRLDSLDGFGRERRDAAVRRVDHQRGPLPELHLALTGIHPELVVFDAADPFLVDGRCLLGVGERDVRVGIVRLLLLFVNASVLAAASCRSAWPCPRTVSAAPSESRSRQTATSLADRDRPRPCARNPCSPRLLSACAARPSPTPLAPSSSTRRPPRRRRARQPRRARPTSHRSSGPAKAGRYVLFFRSVPYR